jgi:spore maturation protein CgeB
MNTLTPVDIGNGYIREFVKDGAFFFDFFEAYSELGQKRTERKIFDFIEKNRIDIVVVMSESVDFRLSLEFYRKLREKCFVAMMIGDTDYYFEVRDRYYAQAIDLVITYDYLSTFAFRKICVDSIALYSSWDGSRYKKLGDTKKTIDVSFVGAVAGKNDRIRYIERLAAVGIRVEVFGVGSTNGQVTQEKMVELFNASRINLNFTGTVDTTRLTRDLKIQKLLKQVKGRIAEIALCGGFVLTEYAPGTEQIFEPGKEIETFYCEKDLVEKIKHYLKHDDERGEIAKNGYIRAARDYDGRTAIPKLITLLGEKRKNKKLQGQGIYIDDVFLKNYSTYRILMFLRFVKNHAWRNAAEELALVLKYRRIDWYQMRVFAVEEIIDAFPKLKSALKKLAHTAYS